MTTITYRYADTDRTGLYSLEEDRAACEGAHEWQEVCMPYGERVAREYGYSHGGAEYRALMDAIYAAEGEDAILDGRSVATTGHTRAELAALMAG